MNAGTERLVRWGVVCFAIATVAGMGIETTQLAERPLLGMSEMGTEVVLVSAGGPAEEAGLRNGDRIVAIAGRPVASLPDPSGFLRRTPVGRSTPLVVDRDGIPFTTEIVPDPLPPFERAWGYAHALIAVIMLTIGAFVCSRRPTRLTGVFFVLCTALSILLFRPHYPATDWAYTVETLVVALLSATLPGMVLHLFLLFPYERAALVRRPWLQLVIYLPGILLFPLMNGRWGAERIRIPLYLAERASNAIAGLYWVIAIVCALGLFATAYRRNPLPTVRQKLRVTALGVAVSLVPLLAVLAIRSSAPDQPIPGDRLATLAIVFLPASIGFAIARHGIFDIERMASRGLVYASMTSLFVLLYFVAFFSLRLALRGVSGLDDEIGTILAFLFVVVVLSPIRSRMQDRIDRWIYPDRYAKRRPLHEAAVLFKEARGVEAVENVLLRAMERMLGVQRAGLYRPSRNPEQFMLTRSIGLTEEEIREASTLGRHLLESVFNRKEPLLREDLEAELPYGYLPSLDLTALRTFEARVLVPFRTESSPESEDEPPPDASHSRLALLVLGTRAFHEPYTAPDLELIEAIQLQAGLALENAKFLEESRGHETIHRELEMARVLQRSLFPHDLPHIANLELAAINRPCHHVGGDYYDCQLVSNGNGAANLLIAIGDVAGHGVPAALLMASVQATLRAEAQAGQSPNRVLSTLNERLCAIRRPDRFVSLFCAELDPRRRCLRYANGGHLHPILVRAQGPIERLDRGGLLLGIREPVAYEPGEVMLDPGDLLLLFTDGVIERGGPDGTFGELALQSFVARHRHLSAHDLLGRIFEEVDRVEQVGEADDTTLFALKML